MQKIAIGSLLTAFVLVGCLSPAGAEISVTVSGGETPTTTIEGNVAVQEVGTPVLQGAVASLNGNSLEIQVKGDADKTSAALSGLIVKSELTRNELKGFVAFKAGTALAQIDDPSVEEMIEVEGGKLVTGHLSEIGETAVKINDQEVSLSQISRLCSPRIYAFVCPLVAVASPSDGSFAATGGQIKLSRTTSRLKEGTDTDSSAKRCCRMPPIPVVVPKGKKGGHHIHIVIPI